MNDHAVSVGSLGPLVKRFGPNRANARMILYILPVFVLVGLIFFFSGFGRSRPGDAIGFILGGLLFLAIAGVLERLSEIDPRQALVVEYRFFAGLEVQEVAEILGVSIRTVHRDWIRARAWLRAELTRAGF